MAEMQRQESTQTTSRYTIEHTYRWKSPPPQKKRPDILYTRTPSPSRGYYTIASPTT
jgi:hypothetical protein